MDAAAAAPPTPFDHEAFLKFFDRRLFKLSAYSCLLFMLYAPVGVLLMLIRSLILVALVLLFNLFPALNKNPYLIRFTSISLGVHTSLVNRNQSFDQGGLVNEAQALKILVANHVSSLDYVAIKSVVAEANYFMSDSNRARVYQAERAGTAGSLVDLVVSKVVNILKSKSLKDDEDSLENRANYPLVCFPEVIPTNGKYGLLRFDTFPFDLDSFQSTDSPRIVITPVCLQMKRPFLAFTNNYYKSNELYDVLTTIFSPITIYEVTFLGAEVKRPGESSEEFADRVQKSIAACLNLKSSEFNYEDMRLMCTGFIRHRQMQLERQAASRQAAERERNQDERRASSVHMTDLNQIRSLSIDKLALQVKEILPYVSYSTIQMHINKSSTLDIDTIIASILDSNQEETECATFTLDSASPSSASLKESGASSARLNPSKSGASLTASSSSASLGSRTPAGSSSSLLKKSPCNAYLSYDERKFNLINEARQRYLAKHPEYYSQAGAM